MKLSELEEACLFILRSSKLVDAVHTQAVGRRRGPCVRRTHDSDDGVANNRDAGPAGDPGLQHELPY